MEHLTPPGDHAGSDPEYDAWFLRQVQIGLDQANAGLLIPHEKIELLCRQGGSHAPSDWT